MIKDFRWHPWQRLSKSLWMSPYPVLFTLHMNHYCVFLWWNRQVFFYFFFFFSPLFLTSCGSIFRCWPINKPTSNQCRVWCGVWISLPANTRSWTNIKPTFRQLLVFVFMYLFLLYWNVLWSANNLYWQLSIPRADMFFPLNKGCLGWLSFKNNTLQ